MPRDKKEMHMQFNVSGKYTQSLTAAVYYTERERA